MMARFRENYNIIAYFVVFSAIIFTVTSALPTSLLESTKVINLRTNKVKRTPENGMHHPQTQIGESNPGSPIAYFSSPSAKKRGASNIPIQENSWASEEQTDSVAAAAAEAAAEAAAALYGGGDDKTVAEYEKGFEYGARAGSGMDPELRAQNAVLKEEARYGDTPLALNQYRYYGRDDSKRRKRGSSGKSVEKDARAALANRYKREIELNPEDVLALLSLWEAERAQRIGSPYRASGWPRYNVGEDMDTNDVNEDDGDDENENWLEAPILPSSHSTGHVVHTQRYGSTSPYFYDKDYPTQQSKRQWGGFGERNKRFMVSRKRSDPTRELRYFTGPSRGGSDDNLYTLSQLLGGPSQQRDTNIPLYRRVML